MQQRSASRTIKRFQVGGLPLIELVLRRLGLRDHLAEALSPSLRAPVHSVETLVLLAVNLTIAKDPLYELADWVDSLDLRALGWEQQSPPRRLADDRFGRALDALYAAERTPLLTRLAVAAIDAFEVQCDRIHNDSTTVKACGRIPGRTRTGLELRHGNSKDHRPDLRQLVYTLSVSADGAVPIHHHVYPGNRNDDTTHIETWEALARIHGRPDFLYVADCKLCTRGQLKHITERRGRAITIAPENLTEVRGFKEQLRQGPLPKKRLWRRPKPNDDSHTETFELFEGSYRVFPEGYCLYWLASSEKRQRDRESRQGRLAAAEEALAKLAPRLNARRLKRRADILYAANAILEHYRVKGLLTVRLESHRERLHRRRRGRPAAGERCRYAYRHSYSLHWSRDGEAIAGEARTDGVFPLVCTDALVPPKQVVQAYKFQPRLEKRFCQFKSVHLAAPLLFKKIERVEANMFVFFIALMIQALLERLLRQRLAQRQAPPLKLYPEDRDALHPTTSQLLKTFEGLCTYTISEEGRACEECQDPLNDTHRAVLDLLDLSEEDFWNMARRSQKNSQKDPSGKCGK